MRPAFRSMAALLVGVASAISTRGAEPTSPFSAELGSAFDALARYDGNQPRAPLARIEAWVQQSTGDAQRQAAVAPRLTSILTDPQVPDAGRRFAGEQLCLVSGEAQVPALVQLLGNAEFTDLARRVLEATPGDAALAALRTAAETQQGVALAGVLNALGVRRDPLAVPNLRRFAAVADPVVAGAAIQALGKIGTGAAAEALAAAAPPPGLERLQHDAELTCAERLAGADPGAAAALFLALWTSDRPASWRLGALAGLTRTDPVQAVPAIAAAIRAADPLLSAAALQVAATLPGDEVTAMLAQELPALPPGLKAEALEVLAGRGAGAGPVVTPWLEDADETVRVAAVRAVARVGADDATERLLRLAAAGPDAVRRAAREGLVRLTAPRANAALMAAAQAEPAEVRVEAIRALGNRHAPDADRLLIEAAAASAEPVRRAAFEALAAASGPDRYVEVVGLLCAAPTPADREAAEKAVIAGGGRLETPAARTEPVVTALATAPAPARPSLLRVLSAFGGAAAVGPVRQHLTDTDPAVRDAAVRTLTNWPDASALPDLLAVARDAPDAAQRLLAFRGCLRLVRTLPDSGAKLSLLRQLQPLATAADTRKLFLAGVGEVADLDALELAAPGLQDALVKAEAALAMVAIGRSLLDTYPAQIQDLADRLVATVDDPQVKAQAVELGQKARQGPDSGDPALRHNPERSGKLRELLAARTTALTLAGYLDCGPDVTDGDSPRLRLRRGRPWHWPGADAAGDTHLRTVAFDGAEVEFELARLDPAKHYQFGFTWWDYDHDERTQSVWATPGGREDWRRLVDSVKLPSFQARSQKPQELTVVLPPDLCSSGAARVAFRRDGGVNAVVSEVWLWVSDTAQPPVAPPPELAAAATPRPPAAIPKPSDPARKHVLIVTGVDMHDWRSTTPVLKGGLGQDSRVEVLVLDDPHGLEGAGLDAFDAVVLHFMNWQVPAPGAAARENLRQFVAGGKGLVLVHFACGAWQDWPEFATLAGRVWDPKLRGHDPRGPFQVEFAAVDHPIPRGLKPFQTDDELYTCLAGDAAITVLATATSKVDGKVYPMAFVRDYGQGRVFHCVLGHDAKALGPEVLDLFRRGTAWSMGIEPQ